MDLSAMIDRDGNSPDFSNFTVELTYPKQGGGTGKISLKPEAELYKEDDPNDGPDLWDNCWCLDPWMEANPNQSDGGEWNPPEDRIVSDFTSTRTLSDFVSDFTASFVRLADFLQASLHQVALPLTSALHPSFLHVFII